eukprot:6177861-Pleurochrysis_carterae.AAC.1
MPPHAHTQARTRTYSRTHARLIARPPFSTSPRDIFSPPRSRIRVQHPRFVTLQPTFCATK